MGGKCKQENEGPKVPVENADWKMQDWKTKDQMSILETAGPESEGPDCTGWKVKDQTNNIVVHKCYA